MRPFFISYRRDDAEADAGRIADRFHAAVGHDEVFFDTSAIEGGDRWMEGIDQALSEAQVMLVVIGRSWLTLPGADGTPRLLAPDDVVAYEIGNALKRGIRVIPSGCKAPFCRAPTPCPPRCANWSATTTMRCARARLSIAMWRP